MVRVSRCPEINRRCMKPLALLVARSDARSRNSRFPSRNQNRIDRPIATAIHTPSQFECDSHTVVIISTYHKALQIVFEVVSRISVPIETSDDAHMLALIESSIGTKLVIFPALGAVRTVAADDPAVLTVDVKFYTAYTSKAEGQTTFVISMEADFARLNEIGEGQVKAIIDCILEFNSDLVITEEGATIVNRVEDLRQTSETVFGLFNIETIGDEQIRLLLSHRYPKCLTANDLFPHLPDPVHDPESVPYTPPRTARGYPERHRPHLADAIRDGHLGRPARARAVTGVDEGLFRAVAVALEMIPRKLVQNAAGNAIRALSALRTVYLNIQNCHRDDVVQATRKERWVPKMRDSALVRRIALL
ncbi:hypothetical protein BC827DRAFT_1154797 [Russula dissimulans]|nr:hypothetical protein BC827DRAFT_1154797 [Russula dissimulans]